MLCLSLFNFIMTMSHDVAPQILNLWSSYITLLSLRNTHRLQWTIYILEMSIEKSSSYWLFSGINKMCCIGLVLNLLYVAQAWTNNSPAFVSWMFGYSLAIKNFYLLKNGKCFAWKISCYFCSKFLWAS